MKLSRGILLNTGITVVFTVVLGGAILHLKSNVSKADYISDNGIDRSAVTAAWNLGDDQLITDSEGWRSNVNLYGSGGAASQRNADFDTAHPSNPLAAGTDTVNCSIEQQRFVAEAFQIAYHTPTYHTASSYTTNALKALQWSFDHQGADGGFPCTITPSSGLGGAYHSSSFIAESTARSLLLFAHVNDAANQALITTYLPKLQALTKWELRSDVAAAGQANNLNNYHRRWLLAAGFAETAALTDPTLTYSCPNKAAITTLKECLLSNAQDMVQDALAHEVHTAASQGYFPEKGQRGATNGYDLSYNLVGMHFASIFLSIWPSDTASRTATAAAALQGLNEGLQWSLAHIYDHQVVGTIPDPNNCTGNGTGPAIAHTFMPGEADMTGSTRVYWCTPDVTPSNNIKSFDYHEAIYALIQSYKLTNNTAYDAAAYAMADVVVTAVTTGDAKNSTFKYDHPPLGLCMNTGVASNQLLTASASVTNTQTGGVSAVSSLVVGTGGTLSAARIGADPPNTRYSVLVKAAGYLNRRLGAVYNVTEGCQGLASNGSQALVPGDANQDNTIGISDIVTAIRAFNGGSDTQSHLLNQVFKGSPTTHLSIGDINTMIRTRNTSATGDI